MGNPYPGYQPMPPMTPQRPKKPFWKKLLIFGGGGIGGIFAFVLVLGLILEAAGYNPDGKSNAAASPAATFASASPSSTSSASPSSTSSAPAITATSEAPKVDPAAARAAVAKSTRSTKPNAALAVLASLPVKGRAPKTGYDRDNFGQPWSDDVTVAGGHNGCDTRNDILARDLTGITYKPGSHNCAVLTGTLHGPYTGRTIAFHRGVGTSNAVQIDHMVALSDAWQTGAQKMSTDQRRNFANDPLNLVAVDGPTNESKGDGDAATWLPPNKAYRCTYVTRQVQVKAKYHLWVTSAEHDAIARILNNCARPVAATSKPVPLRTHTHTTTHAPAPRTTTAKPVRVVPTHTVAPPKPAGCSPLSNGGNCYKIGQFCAKRYHGSTGVSADGERMICRNNNRWRWEPL
ncbi:HNH endonuclease family protein [Flexivirga sp.]|uniref:HNH endonuclease family protein n=1 Tax=Flexivirga sp. TaxID=1962927 RepID=UPI003F824002